MGKSEAYALRVANPAYNLAAWKKKVLTISRGVCRSFTGSVFS